MDSNAAFPQSHLLPCLRWEHPIKKRYYKIFLSQDLLGDWTVTRVWGGINQSTGRISHIPIATYTTALELIDKISITRVKRGYILVSEVNNM